MVRTKLIGVGLPVVLLLIICLGLIIGPPLVEKKVNKVVATPAQALSPEAKKLHGTLLVADLHADSLLFDRDLLKSGNYGHVDIPRLASGNVSLQMFTVVTKSPRSQNIESNDGQSDNITPLAVLQGWPFSTWGSLKERALYQSARLHKFAAESGGQLTIIKTKGDLEKFLERRKANPGLVAGILGLEGAHALEGDLANIDVLYNSGFRMIAPTHFFDNELGGSAHGIEKGGLTQFGRDAVRGLEQKNILVDLAHASPKMIDDILDMATRPVVVSHTGVKGTCNNSRNLSDEHIKRIAAGGGVIGIGFWEEAVGAPDVKAVARAILYTANLAGVDHVALGSDFDGTITAPFDASQMARITEALLAEGFSEDEIRLIMGENVFRLLNNVLPQY